MLIPHSQMAHPCRIHTVAFSLKSKIQAAILAFVGLLLALMIGAACGLLLLRFQIYLFFVVSFVVRYLTIWVLNCFHYEKFILSVGCTFKSTILTDLLSSSFYNLLDFIFLCFCKYHDIYIGRGGKQYISAIALNSTF